MKVLIVHQYFKTPEEGGAIRSYYLAKQLVSRKHEVTVLTSHNHKEGSHSVEGITVQYFKIFYSNHLPFWKRILAFIKFVTHAKKFLKANHDYDLAYVITTPLSTGWIALELKRVYGIPYYFEVGDLWPEAPIQMGILKNSLIKQWLYRMEYRIYEESRHIVSLSPDIKRYISYTLNGNNKISTITNMSDTQFLHISERSNGQFSQKNPFIIGYFGTLGRANHLEFLVDFACEIHEKGLPAKVQIMGEGKRKKRIQSLASGIPLVEFVAFGDKKEQRKVLDQCDAVYISYKDVPVLGSGSPNKFFDGLAAGKLVIINFKGWLEGLVKEEECGFYYNPHEPSKGVAMLNTFIQDSIKLKEAKSNARKLAESKFSRVELTNRLCDLIEAKD